MKGIYKLELHQVAHIIGGGSPLAILRVPSGWIYSWGGPKDRTDTFVPYSKEFEGK